MRNSIIVLLSVLAITVSCQKEPDPVSKVVDVTYPTITLKGPSIVHIPVNGSYTDEGATLTDDITGAVTDIFATVSEVDPTTPGIYALRYIAKNANGFKTEIIRSILVLDYTPPAGLDSTFDLSGTYVRTANGIENHVIKIDNGLYVMDNFAGSTAVYPAYMVTPDTNTIDIPAQTTLGFDIDCNSEVLIIGPPTTLKYKVDASGFGTSLRTFVRQ